MGIRDLWMAVTPASQTRSLTQIAITEGFEQERHRERCLRIGIDASIWMNEAQMATKFRPGRGTRAGENPAVRILFYRLCRLLTLPIIPIFVFDGPDRPKLKRGTEVKTGKPHWLTLPFKKFIEAFGFFWHMSPGEAEAELAQLNRSEFIDAIFSEDNDTLVFGARCVMRIIGSGKQAGDQVVVYSDESIKTNPKVQLGREGLFFMAILCGGDYDKVGLDGCGWKTARLLAQSDLATSLFIAASTLSSRAELKEFLGNWRIKFVILLTHDPKNILGRRYPALAKNVTDSFPSVDLLLQYAQPLTSWTVDQVPDITSWELHQPRLSEIAGLCEKYFSWGSSGDIGSRFKGTLWPGIAIRYLLQLPDSDRQLASYASDAPVVNQSFSNLHVLRVCQARLGPGASSTQPDVSGYTIQISTHGLVHGTALGLNSMSRHSSTTLESDCPKTSFWIPSSLLSAALPKLVANFRGKKVIPPMRNYPPVLAPLFAAQESLLEAAKVPSREESLQFPSDALWHYGDTTGLSSTLPTPEMSPVTLDGEGSVANPINLDDQQFVQGSSTGAGVRRQFLGYINLCTPSPSPGAAFGSGFGGYVDLCTPSPSP